MFLRGRGFSKMPCENCAVQFSVFRRKRACSECERYYCSDCLRRGGGTICGPCRVLSTRPLSRQSISHLKVRDLQCFLQRQNVSTRGCVEKEELVSLCVSHVNSGAYRRRGARSNGNPFTGTLKGLTNNINELFNTAFEIRPTPQPAPPPTRSSCYNSMHDHVNRPETRPSPTHRTTVPDNNRFTTRPGGEPDIEVSVPTPETPSTASAPSPRVETHDCYDIEDIDELGWEIVHARFCPAEPLPNDSETLLTETSPLPRRATSEQELRSIGAETHSPSSPLSPASPSSPPATSSGSLHGDLAPPAPPPRARSSSYNDLSSDTRTAGTPPHVTLDQMRSPGELDSLSVRQLKELLVRNRVDYRGAVERADLLQRARLLYADHHKYKNEIDNLSMEECCKICMAAPLECVLLECGHIAACTACSRQLAECPICRQYIVRAVRFFRS